MTRRAPAQTPSRVDVSRYALPVLIPVLVFLCFLPALHADFVNWDDPLNFIENPYYRGLSWSHLRWMFTTLHMGHYQPLTWLTHGLVYVVWGMNPFGYHLVNVLLHAANAVLFYLLVLTLLRGRWPTDGHAREIGLQVAATVGALVFAIHPLRVEAVAWATERREVLAAFFLLLSVLAYLRMAACQGTGAGHWRRWYALSLCAYALSFLSKSWGMTLAASLLVLDVYPLGRWRDAAARRRLLVEKVPYAALAVAAFVGVALAGRGTLSTLEDRGVSARLAQVAYSLCFYVWKTAVPLWLSPLYLLPIPLNPLEPRFIVSALAVLAGAALLVRFRARAPWAVAAVLVYAMTASPVLGFFHSGPQIAADRYTYLSCLPWAVLAAAGTYQLSLAGERGRLSPFALYSVAAVISLALALLGVCTYQQTRLWGDSLALWNHAVQTQPRNYFAYNNRGTARQVKGDLDGALEDFSYALQLNPSYGKARANRGNIRRAQGDLDGALDDLTVALRLDPEQDPAHPDIYNSRGSVRQAQGDLAGALDDFSRALRLNPHYAEAYYNRGNARSATGDHPGAIADYGEALHLNPQSVSAYTNRGTARQAQGDLDAAIDDFTAALRLDPAYADAYYNRGNARSAKGDRAGAIADYSEALRLNPHCANAYYNRGNVRRTQGDLDGAIEDFSQALQLAQNDGPYRTLFERNLAATRHELAERHSNR